MKALSREFAPGDLCAAFAVSRSSYYAWRRRVPSPRAQANAQLAVQIQALFEQHRQNYGSRRITAALRRTGTRCNHKRVERLMRQQGLKGRQPRRYRVRTTDSRHDEALAPNRLPEVPIRAPNQAWAVDLTYVPTGEGWLYVAGVLDLYSRKLVGWATADHLHTSLPLAALERALAQRQPPAGWLHHSDRGVQYASQEYRQKLSACNAQVSMSRKANCYDNAAMESFWSTLKNELIHRDRYPTRAQAHRALFAWIETYYNRVRLHSSLGYQSPVDFENQLN